VTLYALNDSGERVTATPGTVGRCSSPTCGARMIAKCGRIYIWHWAHDGSDCDPWHEPETDWHRWWKSRAAPECSEVWLPPHSADIRREDGYVIELQHSAISTEEIGERERFYGRVAWVFDAAPFRERLLFRHDAGEINYAWRHARPTPFAVTKPLFLDLGPRVFEVNLPMGSRGSGLMQTKQEFLSRAKLRTLDASEVMACGVTLSALGLKEKDAWQVSRDFDSIEAARETTWFKDRLASRGWKHLAQYADGAREPLLPEPEGA
jgi:hypothetical protein